ncbi:MAG: hypothetical protein M3Q79_01750 [bacterium]|nr:hypothetical protein [bacterium]
MMKLLRRLFFLKTIYFKQTTIQILIFYTFAIIGLFLVYESLIARGNSIAWIMPVVVLTIYFIIRSIIRTVIVNKYVKGLLGAIHSSVVITPPAEVSQASINLELNTIDHLRLITAYKNGRLFLATFDFHRRTRSGTYLAKNAYYIVFEIQLKRYLPHVLFDRKNTKRSQFKTIYLKAQRVSVQSGFDDIFDTYAPQTYNIDLLSFITPEVMEALVEVKDADIEIINDKLLLYAPLLDKMELETFANKGLGLAAHINDNIDTYRDDRLLGEERQKNVLPFARTLLKSPRKNLMLVVLFGVATISIIISSIFVQISPTSILFNEISVIIYISLVVNVIASWKIISANNNALDLYRAGFPDKPVKNTFI